MAVGKKTVTVVRDVGHSWWGTVSGAGVGAALGTAVFPGVGTGLGALIGGLTGFALRDTKVAAQPEDVTTTVVEEDVPEKPLD